MKRVLLTVSICILLLFSVAIADGADVQGYNAKNGWQYLTFGNYAYEADGTPAPLLWRVLSVENGKAYMVSEYVLFNHRIHDDDDPWIASGGNFRLTELWSILNEGSFRTAAFTDQEWNALVDTPEYGKVFLLSREDLKNKSFGFKDDKSRKAWGTPWALAQKEPNGSWSLFRYGIAYGSHSPYWTRSQSQTSKYAANCTKQKGNLGWIRVVVMDEGCRPACYLDLNQIDILSGSGTHDQPYVAIAK